MQQGKIIRGRNFEIQPEDIDAENHFFDAFDNYETEISASWIVRFLQQRGAGWVSFTYDEINTFYSQNFKHGFRFNRLVDPEMISPSLAREFAGHVDPKIPKGGGWIVLFDGSYYITSDFIKRCHKSSPATQPEAKAS